MTQHSGAIGPQGALSHAVSRDGGAFVPLGSLPPDPFHVAPHAHDTLEGIIRTGFPQRGLPDAVNAWRKRNVREHLARQLPGLVAGRTLLKALRAPHVTAYGALGLRVIRADGTVEELGLASVHVVTTAAVSRIVDGLQSSGTDLSLWRFHGWGTGATAAAVGDTTLGTELTTQYVGDTRVTGSQTEASATVYRSVATLSPDSGGTIAVTEHGIFTAASAGTLLDRSVFSAVNLTASADSLQTTYDLTVAAGG
jgi:hypothetical protein